MLSRATIKAALLCALVVVAAYLHLGHEVHTISGEEAQFMEPAVRGDKMRIFTTGWGLPPRGAVAWFRDPRGGGRAFVSRVVGEPGDRIAVVGGELVRNGARQTEDYAQGRIAGEELAEVTVPAWHVWVLNDRRGARGSPTADSRALGPIPAGQIRGWLGGDAAGVAGGDPADAGGAP
jgi:signal peptidase I